MSLFSGLSTDRSPISSSLSTFSTDLPSSLRIPGFKVKRHRLRAWRRRRRRRPHNTAPRLAQLGEAPVIDLAGSMTG
ncbi:hypothetical protein J6590_001733 [Homalodisca vitripennis]|nr:hypothetical protein J6590_001733 [Homalodisca vitripennis]